MHCQYLTVHAQCTVSAMDTNSQDHEKYKCGDYRHYPLRGSNPECLDNMPLRHHITEVVVNNMINEIQKYVTIYTNILEHRAEEFVCLKKSKL